MLIAGNFILGKKNLRPPKANLELQVRETFYNQEWRENATICNHAKDVYLAGKRARKYEQDQVRS